MPLTPAELAQLHRIAARVQRRRLGLGERARLALQGLGELLGAWWRAWRGASPRVTADRQRIARRKLRAARLGRG